MTKTKTKKAKPTVLEMVTAALVDEIGGVMAIIADFEKKKKAMVKELLERAGNRSHIDGNLYTATIVPECTVTALDVEQVKKEMGDEWVAEHSKEGTRKASVRVAARKTPAQKKEK
jgi:hypothetical protein